MALSGSPRVLLTKVQPLVKLRMGIDSNIAHNNFVADLERADVHFDLRMAMLSVG